MSVVLTTLAYTSQFQYPLTKDELWQRLIYVSGNTSKKHAKPLSKAGFNQELKLLLAAGKIVKRDNCFALAGEEDFFAIRDQRSQFSQRKWQELQTFLYSVRRISWVKAVAVTGSLAMDNATERADIDFMIVTQARRLWLTRLVVIVIAWWHGKRRSWQGEEENSWCFNLWLSEQQLAMTPERHSVYAAYEVIQAVFVLDRAKIQEKFYQANAWVKQYLPNWDSDQAQAARRALSTQGRKKFDRTPPVRLWDGLEWLAYQLQLTYMKPHMTRETVSPEAAFFHPRDTRQQIEKKWQKKSATSTSD